MSLAVCDYLTRLGSHENWVRKLDHWPFHKAGIPAIFVYPDRQADSKHIHTAKDEWRSDFPFEGLVQYARVVMQISKALEK